jgi:hypothetical protein
MAHRVLKAFFLGDMVLVKVFNNGGVWLDRWGSSKPRVTDWCCEVKIRFHYSATWCYVAYKTDVQKNPGASRGSPLSV